MLDSKLTLLAPSRRAFSEPSYIIISARLLAWQKNYLNHEFTYYPSKFSRAIQARCIGGVGPTRR